MAKDGMVYGVAQSLFGKSLIFNTLTIGMIALHDVN